MRVLICTLALVVALSSCKHDKYESKQDETVKIGTSIPNRVGATINDVFFGKGEELGFYMEEGDGTAYQTNIKGTITDDAGAMSFATAITYPSAPKTLTIYGYYPYSATAATGTMLTVNTVADQSTAKGYNSMDFMTSEVTGLTKSKDAIPMSFSHKQSKVLINVLPGNNYDMAALKTATFAVKIKKVANKCTYDYKSKAYTTDFTTADSEVTAYGTFAVNPTDNAMTGVSALLPPKTSSNDYELWIAINGINHKMVMDKELVSNTAYVYNVTVNRSGEIVLVSVKINPWDDGGEINGSADAQ